MYYKFPLFWLVGMQILPEQHELLELLRTVLSCSFANLMAFDEDHEDQNSVKLWELLLTSHISEFLSVHLPLFPYFPLKILAWNHLRLPEFCLQNNCVLFIYPLTALQPRNCFLGRKPRKLQDFLSWFPSLNNSPAYCPVCENSCFACFVYFSSLLWKEGN